MRVAVVLAAALLAAPAIVRAADDEVALSPRIANYEMDVRLDVESKLLHATQVLTWHNKTNTSTGELRYHLYYNGWRNDRSSWFRGGRGVVDDLSHVRDDEWAYSQVEKIELLDEDGTVVADLTDAAEFIAPDDGNPDDRSVLAVALPSPIGPGATARVRLRFTAKVPRTFARTGFRGDYFFLAQWFPKIGVFEAPRGGRAEWNCHQFIQTEFYADFGNYDVRLTVPAGWVVGATGRETERQENGDGTVTHRYVQADVHDFAWTTSPHFAVYERRFEHDALPDVDMRLLLMPDHAEMKARYFAATEAALKYYGQWWGPYPYDHVTVVDPAYKSRTGGMEYPTLFTGGTRWISPRLRRSPEGVTVHEAGHQFFYGIMANNEYEHAWLDEGFNTYSTTRVMQTAFPEHAYTKRYFDDFISIPFPDIVTADRTDGADKYPGVESELKRDSMRHLSWKTGPYGYRINAYDKPAMMLRSLENFLGWQLFQQVVSTYFARHAFKHPRPEDFFAVAEHITGLELDWFFASAYEQAHVYDYAVGEVVSRRIGTARGFDDQLARGDGGGHSDDYESVVHVRRWGEGVYPVTVEVVFDDGMRKLERWDGRDRWARFKYRRESKVKRVRVDPDRQLVLDINATNNGWLRDAPAGSAATKWASKWMVYVQATLEAFATFG